MTTSLQLRSLVTADGHLELSLARVPVPDPGPDEVVVEVRATPINPSDLGLLLGPAAVSTARASGSDESTVVTLAIPERMRPAVAGRVGQSLPVGNEGAGVVVRAGASPAAQALLGKTVAMIGGGMYAQLRTLRAADVIPLPEGVTAAEGASCFVNPLTALAMIETMRREGHTALVHTAAASNLGQMLVKLCLEEKIPLVNVVRRPEQQELLRSLGATHVLCSASPTFGRELQAAIAETGATLAFDAVGGGRLAGDILAAMEAAAVAKMPAYSRYGSPTKKKVYVYGMLDLGPTEIPRSVGLAWTVSGFLLTYFLQEIGPAEAARLRQRVLAGLRTTFASHYAQVISLFDVLDVATMSRYAKRATGEKILVDPSLPARRAT